MNSKKCLALSAGLLILTAPLASLASPQTEPVPAASYQLAQMTRDYNGPVLRDFNGERSPADRSEINDYKFDAYPDSADPDDMDRGIDNSLLIGSFIVGAAILFMVVLFKRGSLGPDLSQDET